MQRQGSTRLGGDPAARAGNAPKLTKWPTGMDPSRCSVSDLTDMFATPIDDPSRPSTVRILHPGFRHYGGMLSFRGRVTTLTCNDSNPLVRKTLNEDGAGRVLVIDGGASKRCALVGDRLTEHAYLQGWAGILVNGCVRDVSDLRNFLIGVMALDSHPLKPGKKDVGQRDVPVTFAGVTIHPGDWLYADEDGILVSSTELVMPKDAPKGPIPLSIPTDEELLGGSHVGRLPSATAAPATPVSIKPAVTATLEEAAAAVAALDIMEKMPSPFATRCSRDTASGRRRSVSFRGVCGEGEG